LAAGTAAARAPGIPVSAGDVPLIEAPPPKGQTQAPPLPGRVVGAPSNPGSVSGLDPESELELQRQLEADQYAADAEAELLMAEPVPDEQLPTPVPPDLIADIESFKHQTRRGPEPEKVPEKARGPGRVADKGAPAATPRPALAPLPAGDPSQLSLTRAQEAELPSFLMTAHIYDADPSRRFVLINGLKYREGEQTREGLTVQQIRADGAVLVFRGSPFFRHR
jgi:general secretion pathway protein B